MKRYLLYFVLSCSFCLIAKAQSNYLQITNAYFTDSSGTPITNLIAGQIINYVVTIKNLNGGGLLFSDTVVLACQINPNNNFVLYRYPNPYQLLTLPPLGSDTIIFRDSVTINRYGGGGGGTVVIWPVTVNSTFVTIDSFLLPYIYANTESIFTESATLWKIYPNPTQKTLFIQNIEAKNKIEYVRFFNTEGILVKEKKEECTEIDLADLPEGIYFLLIRDKMGKQGVYKIQIGR